MRGGEGEGERGRGERGKGKRKRGGGGEVGGRGDVRELLIISSTDLPLPSPLLPTILWSWRTLRISDRMKEK